MPDRLLRTLRCRNSHRPGVLGRLASAVGAGGANIGDIRTVWAGPEHIVRDLDVLMADEDTLEATIAAVNSLSVGLCAEVPTSSLPIAASWSRAASRISWP